VKKMVRNILVILTAVGFVLTFLACESDNISGPVNLEDDAPPSGVSGKCMNGVNPENGVTCKTYYSHMGIQVFNTDVSHNDPVQGDGFYNCTSTGSDPYEGDVLIVRGTKNGQPWGASAEFAWVPPYMTHITLWKY
jgi:hypothetical protein